MLTFVPHKINENYNKVEFYRVNKELCDNELYSELTPNAILLYSILADRLSLTYANINKKSKNNFCDKNGEIFIIFTRIDLEKKLHIKKHAITSAFKQLKKVNLVKEKRQGKNKPNKIYVGKTYFEKEGNFFNWKSENQTSGSSIFNTPVVRNSNTNKNNIVNNKNKKNSFTNYEQRDYSKYDFSKLYANKF